MTELISKLLSKATSSQSNQPGAANTSQYNLLFKPDHHDSHITTVHIADSPDSAPIFTVRLQSFHKPNIILFRNTTEIGHGTFPNFRHTSQMTYQGQPTPMRVSGMTGYQSFDAPKFGRLEWQPAVLVGSTIELRDASGNKLGRYKTAGIPGTTDKKLLELYVPVDEYIAGLLVLTVMATAAQVPKGSAGGGVGDAVSAVAGV